MTHIGVGEDVKILVAKVLEMKHHPEHLYKMCMGILNLSKKYGNDRLIKACQRALSFGIYNYRTIKKILENGLDRTDEEDCSEKFEMPQHDNIRGSEYYY